MAGIYIHIPFCKQACSYCNFHFSTLRKNLDLVVESIITEISLRAKDWQDERFTSIYFGGGTPSLLSPDHIARILEELHDYLPHIKPEEFTLEANPDDLTEAKLKAWKNLGVNRLSMGIQSFRSQDLKLLNRSHDAAQALESIRMAKKAGFSSFSIDLIYGIPDLDHDAWRENLELVKQLDVEHLSAYALTVEEDTLLDRQILKGEVKMPSDTYIEKQFKMLQDWAKENGWNHYELSNLSKPGKEAKHNSSYWKQDAYLGLGPSAHGYHRKKRYNNLPSNPAYIRACADGKLVQHVELLTDKNGYNELVMCNLRLSKGLNLDLIDELTDELKAHFEKEKVKLQKKGLLIEAGGFLKIPEQHRFLSDGIAADLFAV